MFNLLNEFSAHVQTNFYAAYYYCPYLSSFISCAHVNCGGRYCAYYEKMTSVEQNILGLLA